MSRPTILVTGATGKTGAALVAELRARDWPVRALVRRRDTRAAALARLGAEIVPADLFDPEAMQGALRGTHRAYWCPPFTPHVVQAASIFADAVRAERIETVVGLSQWLASPAHPSALTRGIWMADRILGALPGVAHTVLNPGFFADNYLRLVGFAAQLGVLPSLTGDSLDAPPSNEDIARVAAAALADPARHGGRTYRPTGPALLSTREMAAILGEVLGRRVRRVEMPMWLFLKAARMQAASAFELSGYRHYVKDHKRGAFALGAPTDDVLEVTGQPPESFATTARRYAARPEARRSLGSQVRAWADFLRTPLMPGYDLEALDRALDLPRPASVRLAVEDADWRATHGDPAAIATGFRRAEAFA